MTSDHAAATAIGQGPTVATHFKSVASHQATHRSAADDCAGTGAFSNEEQKTPMCQSKQPTDTIFSTNSATGVAGSQPVVHPGYIFTHQPADTVTASVNGGTAVAPSNVTGYIAAHQSTNPSVSTDCTCTVAHGNVRKPTAASQAANTSAGSVYIDRV
jgi:hypothetical protein